MTKKELIELIKDVPEDMDIFITKTNTEFGHSLLESAKVEEVTFSEGLDGGPEAKDNVLVLSDDQSR